LLGGNEVAVDPDNTEFGEYADTLDGMTLFPIQEDWRGFSKGFLKKLGAKLAFVEQTGFFYLRFPVMVQGKEVGYFRAQMEKPRKGIPTYLNKPGEWVKTRGLFPFDTAVALAKKEGLRTIVPVEGPRDALRLICDGVPAVSIMGTHNWSAQKRRILEFTFKRMVICMDGDRAGKQAALNIYRDVKNRMDVKVLRLWRIAQKMQLEKMDPFDMPDNVVDRLRGLLI
jgi:5S rRNA maturation endonuclease (ribonuclease M5)